MVAEIFKKMSYYFLQMRQIFDPQSLSVSCHGIPEEKWYLGPEIYTLKDKNFLWLGKPVALGTVHNLLADLLKHSQCEISSVCDLPWHLEMRHDFMFSLQIWWWLWFFESSQALITVTTLLTDFQLEGCFGCIWAEEKRFK